MSIITNSSCQTNKKTSQAEESMVLATAPKSLSKFKEIAIQYDENLPHFYNSLAPEERVLIYYLFRASLPGNRIAADQQHQYAVEIIDLFKSIYNKKDLLLKDQFIDGINITEFIDDVKTYLVYLWTNHGQYFLREHADEKRTPERLGLTTLTKENVVTILTTLGNKDAQATVDKLAQTIFDHTYQPSATVLNNIEQSGINIYAHGFTNEDFTTLSHEQQTKLNAYFTVETKDGKRIPTMIPYSTTGKYSQELTISTYWLKKAHAHVQQNPQHFDVHLLKSLEYMIKFLESGDEALFKKHSIEWLKSSSKIDYCFGFIETYSDPKSYRGFFQAEATVKSIDINKLNALLPSLEQQLPVPAEYKRESLGSDSASIPNASINQKIFGAGHLGPMNITAAYNLPNYEEIRSQFGSKQIIYPASKSLEMRINPDLARKLFHRATHAAWLKQHDQEGKLDNDLWDVHVILHETLGHGSGKLAKHTFKEGDKLTISGKTYSIGDTMHVTNANLGELLLGHGHTMEEMRAEIVALYVSINHLDALMSCGLLEQWKKVLSKEELIDHLILDMAKTGFKRMLQQNDTATEISGDHARANSVIMNYLIDHGSIVVVEEKVKIDDKKHTVIDLALKDRAKAHEDIKNLMILVQQIKSTGDGQEAHKLIETYGRKLRNPEYLKILKENRKSIVGDLKTTANIYPHFMPVYDKTGTTIQDIKAEWPQDIFEQYKNYEAIELSTEEPFAQKSA